MLARGAASPTAEAHIHRLVLWNIDLTLVDVARVTRAAYVDAFAAVTGRPLVRLPQMAGRTESEIFFDALALNDAPPGAAPPEEHLLDRFTAELAAAFRSRRGQLTAQGRLLPGAREALAEVAALPGVVQTVLTGSIKPNAMEKLHAFGLDEHLDVEIGGYGSEVFPKGALLLSARGRACAKYGADFADEATVYVGDSTRDVEAARVAGARCLGVASGRSTAGELREAGADAVFDDLSDAKAVAGLVDRITRGAPG